MSRCVCLDIFTVERCQGPGAGRALRAAPGTPSRPRRTWVNPGQRPGGGDFLQRQGSQGGDGAGASGCLHHKQTPSLHPHQVAQPRTALRPDSALPALAPSPPACARGSRLACPDGAPSVSHVSSLSKDSTAGGLLGDPANLCVGQTAAPKTSPSWTLLGSAPHLRRPQCHTAGRAGGQASI